MAIRSPPLSEGLALSPRDSNLVMLAYEWRYLRPEHIAALCGLKPTSAARLVRRLAAQGFLDRLTLPVFSGHALPGPIILGRLGRRLVAQSTGQPVRRIARPSVKRLSQVLFLDHALRINDVRLAFTLCGQDGTGVLLHTWRGEQECHDRVLNPLAAQPWLPVRPDTYAELRVKGRTIPLFLEIDLGTTPPRRFAQKVQGYIAYRTGLTHYGLRPCVPCPEGGKARLRQSIMT